MRGGGKEHMSIQGAWWGGLLGEEEEEEEGCHQHELSPGPEV